MEPTIAAAHEHTWAIYGGILTENSWEKSLKPDADMAEAYVVVVAPSWTFYWLFEKKISLSVEAQLGKHFAGQDHWEINLPIVGFRWHPFPWNAHVDTSFAWGIGPSYASQIPEIELINSDKSHHWLIHWYGEFSFGPPSADWEFLARLQHRSDGFGALHGGSSNALCAGLRYRF